MPFLPARLSALLGLVGLLLGTAVARAGEFRARIVDQKSKPVADAVLALTPLDFAAPKAAPAQPVEIVQVDRQYTPYVTPLQVGTTAVFPNADTVQHHIYSVSKPKRFEKALYAPGAHETVVFDQPGVVALGCNIHDWMVAYVVVVDTPFFAKSADAGTVTLNALPAGRYRLDLWHPRLAKAITREIALGDTPAAEETFTLTLKADRRLRQAPEARGRAY